MSKRTARANAVTLPNSTSRRHPNADHDLVALMIMRRRRFEAELAQTLESIAACDQLIQQASGAPTTRLQ